MSTLDAACCPRYSLGVNRSAAAAALAIALAAAPQIAPLLYRVSPADPVSIAGAALFLIVVAVLASLIPALRATRVDPIRALRQE